MSFWRKLALLLPGNRRAEEQEMEEELRSLAAMAEPGELGNLTRVAEEARAVWTWTLLEQTWHDVRYAVRTMRQNPGFTATAVLSLGLGIGANTAIFSLIDALMLRWLPVRNPQELVQIKFHSSQGAGPAAESFSQAIVATMNDQKDIFSGVCGFSTVTFDVGLSGSITRIPGAWATGSYYETLGVNPVLGRLLGPADDQPGAPLVAVLSYGYWERQFTRDPDVVGRNIRIDGVPVTIVGVSARGFQGANVGAAADITVPVAALAHLEPALAGLLGPGNFWLRALGRPQPGVSVQQAQAHLSAVWPQIADRVVSKGWSAARRKELADSAFELTAGGTGYTYLRRQFGTPLLVLLGVTGLVLLIACANVASLLLARATARQREISVRLAIGAGRGRVIRQLLTESTLLSAAGAAMGIWLAWSSSRFLVQTLSSGPGAAALVFDLSPNWHVLGFACAAALLNGIVFGLAPALQTTRIGGPRVIQGDTRLAGSHSRILSALVATQVALSLLLLVGAGLFGRTLQNLLHVDAGYHREGLLIVDLDGQREGYRDTRLAPFYRNLLDRVRQIPGVLSASLASHTPSSGSTWTEAVVPKGQPLPKRENAILIAAAPQFFSTMQTPLLAGREFDARDEGTPNVVIVNETFAKRYFPNQDPVGQFVTSTVTGAPSDFQIVGLVKDVATANLRQARKPVVYVSYWQRKPGTDSLVIRAAGSLGQTAAEIRRQLQPDFHNGTIDVRPLAGQVERTLVQERLMANLAGGFGALGLALAAVGLYGLLGYGVARRRKEIGIRMALGAPARRVVWMVAARALQLVAVGVAVGVPAAWLLSKWIASMLFGLTPKDPTVTLGAVAVLLLAATLAAYLPARRAALVDPTAALRHD